MARSNGRWGRLRRVLNEDLSCSAPVHGGSAIDRMPGDTPRYGAGANIENHPQVTDYIPRRFRIPAIIFAGGAALGTLAELIAHSADSLGTRLGTAPAELTLALSDRLVSWTIAVALLVTAAYARIIFLLKRHRLDDLRGRYRVWRQAAILAVGLSAAFVTSVHRLVAQAIGHVTGMHPLGSDAVWWIVPTVLVGGWIVVRLIRDAAESRLALTSFLLAALCFSSAVACAAGWSLADSEMGMASLIRVLPLVGSLLALSGTLLTARYVVLDVQGLIEHSDIDVKPAATGVATAALEEAEQTETVWTDGSDADEPYDSDRPLTKAERKRLRKHNSRYRAA